MTVVPVNNTDPTGQLSWGDVGDFFSDAGDAIAGAAGTTGCVLSALNPLSIGTSSGGTLVGAGASGAALGETVISETAGLAAGAALGAVSGGLLAGVGYGLIAYGGYQIAQEC